MSTTRKWGLVVNVHHWSPQLITCVCTNTTDKCHSVEVCLVQVWVWRKWQSGMNNLPSILPLLHQYVGDERENLQVWATRVKVTQSPVVCSVRLPAQGKRGRNLVWEFSLKVEPQNPTQINSRCLCTLAFTFELSIDGTAAVETFLFGFSNLALQKDKQTRWLYESCSMNNIKN